MTSYLHKSDPGLPPTLGVLVQLDEAGAEVGQDIAHQIAAMRPQYVTREQVPDDLLANERRIAEQVTREEGKPEQAIPKIVEGRLNAFLKDVVLVEQASVRGPEEVGQAAACRARSQREGIRQVPDRPGRLTLAEGGTAVAGSPAGGPETRASDAGLGAGRDCTPPRPSWRRVVLKLSGEAFAGGEPLGISPDVVIHLATGDHGRRPGGLPDRRRGRRGQHVPRCRAV